MRYAPYSKDFHFHGDSEVTNSFSSYNLTHHEKLQETDETEYPSETLELQVKQKPRGPIKEHLKRHFTPLTTMNHHTAGSDGSCSPSSAGSPVSVSETVTLKTVKHEFPGIGMPTNHGCEMCAGCGSTIVDKYLLKVGKGLSWHVSCLHCCTCHGNMNGDMTCYVKEGRVYCKLCYARQFGVKCSACTRTIQSTDWVRRAKNSVFHLACFACDNCKRQLSTGEEFAMVDHKVVCKTHYLEMLNMAGSGNDDNGSVYGSDTGGKTTQTKTKRVRTTFTEEQVEILQANFNMDSNPDGQDLERIARITGLSKRVTQVWFQNSRARQKKYSVNTSSNQDKDGKISTGSRRDLCRKCGVVYCMCRSQSPGYHKGRSVVPSSPPTPSPHQPLTTQ